MKSVFLLTCLTLLTVCQSKQDNKKEKETSNIPQRFGIPKQQQSRQDGLFKFDIKINKNLVNIIPPKNSNFKFPDSTAKTKPYKFGDFNADKKEDILVYLGACGTGGCMYGLFLKQKDNYYKLAFMDYLKNAAFKIEKNGLWKIESSEEIEPYNPSKLKITTFKFDIKKYQYKLDKTYVYIDK